MTTTVTNPPTANSQQPTAKPHTWRTLLLAVGLALLLFSCFLTYGLFATATGWISDLTADTDGAENYTYYDQQHSDRYPVLTAEDKQECQARSWQLITVQSATGQTIAECWQPGATP